jgi:hypothetical protein
VVGLALALAGPAQAQVVQPVGKVVGLPLSEYARFLVANILQQRSVRFLHLSNVGAGPLNSAIVTVSVTQNNGTQPTETVFIPTPGATTVAQARPFLTAYQQVNAPDTYVVRRVVNSVGNSAMEVIIKQGKSGTYTPGATRWCLVPEYAKTLTVKSNPGVKINFAHRRQVVIGGKKVMVALAGVPVTNAVDFKVAAPEKQQADLLAMLPTLNTNVNTTACAVDGPGNAFVACVTVNQQNGP